MASLILLGLGAGLAAALLFGTVAVGAPLAVILCYLAPLPIVIATLGWHRQVGLLACFVGASALALALRSSAGTAFLFGPALPAWLLACLVLTGRALAGPDGVVRTAWLAPGAVLFATGLAGAFLAVAAAVGLGQGDATDFEAVLRRATVAILSSDIGLGGRVSGGEPNAGASATFVNLLVLVAPAVAAAAFAVGLAANLWLGAKTAALSGRLPRPWSSLPETQMPRIALGVAGFAIVLCLLSGWPAILGRALAGGLAMAFALGGLALLHAATRGRSGRGAILFMTYVLTLFFGGTVLPILALAGMVDSATTLRRRFPPPPPTPRP